MWKLNYKERNKGFTLIEILVTMGIIGILASLAVVSINKVKASSKQATCIAHLKQITLGMQLYYEDYRRFPQDGYPDDGNDPLPLSSELASYVTVKHVFVCPEDDDPTSISNFASYDPYYVERRDNYDVEMLLIGCPRHRDASNATSVVSSGSTSCNRISTVLANGQEIQPDGTTAQRTINSNNDVMTFDDGSTVTVTNASGGSYGCILVQSVQLADGILYSIVKVQDEGTIDVQVTSGSKFEIVTPSAIVGVRGTQFTVTTTNLGYTTDVTLTTGDVLVTNRATNNATNLTDGGLTQVTVDESNNDDFDGDGYRKSQGDSNDYNPNIHPGATELLNSGVDEDSNDEDYNPATEYSAADQVLVDLVNQDPPLNSSDLKSALLDESSLSSDVLLATIDRVEPMNSSDLKAVLLDESSLSSDVLLAAIDRAEPMNSSDLKDVLIGESPLAANVLQAAIDRKPSMNSGDLQSVLDAQ